MQPVPLEPEERSRLRTLLLAKLIGVIGSDGCERLRFADFDEVLDVAFQFTDAIRLQVSDERSVVILPGGTVQ